VITRKTQTGPAPRVAAAPSSRRSTASIDSRIAHRQRKAHHRAGECGTGPAKGEHDPEMLVEELAERAAAAEQQQQQVAGHHRRHDQRQVNYSVEQRFSPEPSARQHQGHENARY
jgi:hypothetical protein